LRRIVTQAAPSRILSDAAIARRAAGGSQRALAAVFERYHQDLYRYCVAILGNAEDAQDAVQNTMVKVLRALPGEKRELKLKPWLYRIAHNEAVDLIRTRKAADPIDAEALAGGGGPAEEAETRRRLRQLVADIAELPERQRGALVMREMSGLSYDQIGEALQTSAAVARQTIYEARLGLRQMSEGREMPCAEAMRAISDDDGRVLRRRDIRSHLRQCESCRAFRAEIAERRHEFAALAPLPAAISAGMLQGLLGGAGGGTGSAGGVAGVAAGKALGTSAVIKSATAVIAVSAIGVVAAHEGGVGGLGSGGHDSRSGAAAVPAGAEGGAGRGARAAAGAAAITRAGTGRRAVRASAAVRRVGVRQGAAADPVDRAAEPASAANPPSSERHAGHGRGTGDPEHPAQGKKSPSGPPGQSKSPGQAKHAASEKTGGKAAGSHPAHPEPPPHPEQSQAASAPGAEAEAPAAAGTDTGKAGHGSAAGK
jgi:RNA polymerase sigma factor (sigma-70 family)